MTGRSPLAGIQAVNNVPDSPRLKPASGPAGKRTVLRLGPVLWDVAYACSLRTGPMTPTGHKALGPLATG